MATPHRVAGEPRAHPESLVPRAEEQYEGDDSEDGDDDHGQRANDGNQHRHEHDERLRDGGRAGKAGTTLTVGAARRRLSTWLRPNAVVAENLAPTHEV